MCGRPLREHGASSFSTELGYCPQIDALWPRLAVFEQLDFFARLRGVTKDEAKTLIETALRALRIESVSNRQFKALSGGTKRKVCIFIRFPEDKLSSNLSDLKALWEKSKFLKLKSLKIVN